MVGVGRTMKVAGQPPRAGVGARLGRRPEAQARPGGGGRTGGRPLSGAGEAERSGTEECGARRGLEEERRSARGEPSGSRERGRRGGRNSAALCGAQGCAVRSRGQERTRTARVQVDLAGRGVPGAWGRLRGSEGRRGFPIWGFSPGLSWGSPYCFLLAELVAALVAQLGLQGSKPFGVWFRGSWV